MTDAKHVKTKRTEERKLLKRKMHVKAYCEQKKM